jgi:hypothetical protein
MSHRTQITLTDEQYARLREESVRTGLGLADLVRRALDRAYGSGSRQEVLAALAASFGGWGEQPEDGAAYGEQLRRGMGRRLARA